jgi:hypothetical protein
VGIKPPILLPSDDFNVRKLFEDKASGSSFYMDVTNPGDVQLDINGKIDASLTSWTGLPNMSLSPPSFRLHVFPSGDNINTVATADHSVAHTQGYMASASDFKNVEFTMYFKILGYLKGVNLDEDYVSVYVRGGVKSNANHGCSGTGYRSGIEFDGGQHATKYYAYPSNYFINPKKSFKFFNPRPATNLLNHWLGMKVLVYDVPPLGKTSFTSQTADVCIEVYYDWLGTSSEPPVPTNNWTRYFQIFDRGRGSMGHGGDTKNCKAEGIYEILQWGGPLVTLRVDNITGIQIKWLSVREIDTAALIDTGTNPPTIPAESLVYNLYPDANQTPGVMWSRLGVVWNDAYESVDKCFGGPSTGPIGGQGPDIPSCDPGWHYDGTAKACVPDVPGTPGTPGGGGTTPPGSGKVYDSFGVQKIYPDAVGGTTWMLNVENPYADGKFNVSYGTGSQYPITKHTDPSGLVYHNTRGEVVTYASGGPSGRSQRLDVYPDGGKWNDKTSYSWDNNPVGYLYTAKGIRSGEFTSFVRGKDDLGSNIHHSWAHKINGRDEDSIRSEIEMVRPTVTHSDIQFNYNYAHSPYVNRSVTKVGASWPPVASTGHWYGFKTVHKVSADRKTSVLEAWVDDDPFDATTGKPKNNWRLAGTINDTGCSEYKNIICTWAGQKDTIRIDGWDSCDFTYLSDREIDPTAVPGVWDAGQGTPGGITPPAPASARQPVNKLLWAIINGQTSTDNASALQYGMLITHELVESLTDPDYQTKEGFCIPGSDEIGDVCTGNTSSTYGTAPDDLYVEGYYSNSDGGCTVNGKVTKTGGSSTMIKDGGGPILQNAVVYLLYWGATWNSDTTLASLKTLIDHKIKDLLLNTDKTYFAKLSQYGSINAPTWGNSVVEATITLPANGISDSASVSFIKQCITKGLVPAPSATNNWQNWYCIVLKPGRYQAGFTNLDNAYHDSASYP